MQEVLNSIPKYFDTIFGGGTSETDEDRGFRGEMRKQLLIEEIKQKGKAFTQGDGQGNSGGSSEFMETDNSSLNSLVSAASTVAKDMEISDAKDMKISDARDMEISQEGRRTDSEEEIILQKRKGLPVPHNQLHESGGGASISSSAINIHEQPGERETWLGRLRSKLPKLPGFLRKSKKGGKKINKKTIKKNNSKIIKKSQKRKTIKKNNSKSKKRKTIKKHKSKSMKKLTRRYKK